MKRKERTEAILHEFDTCAIHFSQRTDSIDVELDSQFKRGNDTEDLTYRRAYLYYRSFMVEFKYTSHATLYVVNSILECLIHLDKNKDGVAIPLAMLLDYCGINTPFPLCIPEILDSEAMREAFGVISQTLENNLQNISEALGNNSQRIEIERNFMRDISELLGTEIGADDPENYVGEPLYSYLTLRFCSSIFINYIKGDSKTAIKQLKKDKHKIGYEYRLLALWESGEITDFQLPLNARKGLAACNTAGVIGTDKKETAAIFFSWLILSIGISVIYLSLFFLLYAIEKANAVYLMGPIYNMPYCLLAAFITSIPASYFTRFRFYRLLFPKDYEAFCATDQVNNGKTGDTVIKWLLHIIVICSLVGTVLFTRWGMKFLDDGFVDNTAFFSVSGDYYQYEDIERVYYLPNRVNALGDTLEYPSFVLVFKNGREIDFYEYDEIEEYEDILIPLLKNKGVRIENDEM